MDTAVCYYCGVRRPTSGMILVEPTPQFPETDPRDSEMWFCDWAHLGIYCTDQLSKEKDA